MITSKTIYKENLIIDLFNYKHAFWVEFEKENKKRKYFKKHKKRLNKKEFLKIYNVLNNLENYKVMFRFLENIGFKKD
jgi:hypothetical protein